MRDAKIQNEQLHGAGIKNAGIQDEALPDGRLSDGLLPDDLLSEELLPEEEVSDGEAEDEVTLSITEADGRQRLDKLLAVRLPELTRSYIQKLFEDGRITLDDKTVKPSAKAGPGSIVTIRLPEPETSEAVPQDIPLDILYEDADIIVVNKPKGMVVHPAPGHPDGTLVNALMFHCGDELSGIGGVQRPGIVHRIDRNTTGSLIICKNDKAHQCIAQQLAVHSITRAYRAIVHGNIREDSGTVVTTIGRHPVRRKEMAVNVSGGKTAVTHFQVLERFGDYTYVECRLETGRTHQIRVHMKHIGHPVLGDDVYGPAKCPVPHLEGQTLHAMTLGIRHPSTGEYMEFTAPLPEYFERLLEKLRTEREKKRGKSL